MVFIFHFIETNTRVYVNVKVEIIYLPSPFGFWAIGPADKNAANTKKNKSLPK